MWGGGEGLQGNCINQQETWSLWEGLLERAELHHLAHGAPSGKQRNDQVTLWSRQPQLASVVGLISGVPWLSSSAPLKPLTNFSLAAHILSSTHRGCGHGMVEAKAPIIPYSGKGRASESKGLHLPCPHFLFSPLQRLSMLASPCLLPIFSPDSWAKAWNLLFHCAGFQNPRILTS